MAWQPTLTHIRTHTHAHYGTTLPPHTVTDLLLGCASPPLLPVRAIFVLCSTAVFVIFFRDHSHFPLKQLFSTFLRLRPFNTVPHGVVSPNHKIIFIVIP